MAFWNRNALLPWPLNNNNNANANNNNNNNANANNNNNNNGAAAAPAAPVANPMARAAAAAGVRMRRVMRGVGGRGFGAARRQQSDTHTAREQDDAGDGLRMTVGEEMNDRFARFKSNQHLAPTVPRTGTIDLKRASTISDEREAAERALIDRFVNCMEKAVGDGIEGNATEAVEAHLVQELRAWQERVRREREQIAETRAYLVARRASLLQKEAALNVACRHIEEATVNMKLLPVSKWSSRF